MVALSCGAKLLNEWEVQGSQYSDNFHACTTAPGNTKRTAFYDNSYKLYFSSQDRLYNTFCCC